MAIRINVDINNSPPFVETSCGYYYVGITNYSNNVINQSKVQSQVLEGIILNCTPSISNITLPSSNFFQNKSSVLKKNVKKSKRIGADTDFERVSIKNKQEYIEETIYFKDIESKEIFQLLNENINKKTSFKNIKNHSLKVDEKLIIKDNFIYNDSIPNFNYPEPIKLLNNEIEQQLLQIDDPLLQYYIYYIHYPMNHVSYINFNEGIHIEPLSFSSQIQFKTKQEFEYNRFYSNLDQSHDSRFNTIQFANKFNSNVSLNKEFTSFFDNTNLKNNQFIYKNSYKKIDSYLTTYLNDNITNTIYDSTGKITKNKKYKVYDSNNKNNIYSKNFISPSTYIFLDNKKKSISPFNDNDQNKIYTNSNYNDLTFKEVFKNNKLIENIQNRQSNIYYESNEKFSSCGFDWSYTNSIGKNSIAFKGLE